jgi:hypothetical protein
MSNWVLRQNYGEKTDQDQMRALILEKKIVTCPWGGWGPSRENVINRIYNKDNIRPGGRSSNNQDKRFVEEMNIGDIIIVPFPKNRGCIVARITSDVIDCIDTGLRCTETEERITLGLEGTFPFKPVGRRIEIIDECFMPARKITNHASLSKMSQKVAECLPK